VVSGVYRAFSAARQRQLRVVSGRNPDGQRES
jgi:hypothetical protein